MIDYLLLMSVVLAGGVTAWFFKNTKKNISLLISFSGAYLFAVIVFHLLPEIYAHSPDSSHMHNHFHLKLTGVFILLGLLFQILLENFSHGLEHAHEQEHFDHTLSIGLITGLFLHAFTEGLPVHQLHNHSYLYGILVHKFPIAFVLVSFLITTRLALKNILLILILFSIMTPLGTYLGEKSEFLLRHHTYVSAFVAGILTHISTVIIFESDRNHKIPPRKLLVIILAFVLAYLN